MAEQFDIHHHLAEQTNICFLITSPARAVCTYYAMLWDPNLALLDEMAHAA